MKKIQILLAASLLIPLTACTKWWDKERDDYNPYEGQTAQQLYTESQKSLAKEKYSDASKRLEAMETMYPFSEYAEKAELDLIYAYYKSEDYPSTAATAERYIHLYPRSPKVDYAYYMKGMANFQQTRGVFAKALPLDESWREPGTQTQAYADFGTLIQKFPQSRYKANALQRMIYLRNMFAQRELNAANYYFGRKMYVAASGRANNVIKNYPQASSVEKALIVLYRANMALGLTKTAAEAETVYMATYHRKIK
jgi:outer membrane protein assembly factor BamD